jgi:AcrR family transcriptional regulator
MSTRKSGSYHSPRRAEQAAATRAAIIAAAGKLFAEQGYAATTMAAIAAEARVTAKSVFTVADKAELLRLAVDRAIVGDTEAVPVADREEFRALLSIEDPAERIRLAARQGAATLVRLYPIYRAFEQAAAAEPALKQHWRDYQHRRRADLTRLAEAIPAPDGAVDTLWALLTWHPVALLVEERGWTEDQVAEWLAGVLTALLEPRELTGTATAPVVGSPEC